MSIYFSGKSRMLVQGDFDQNLVQRSDGSGTKVFKHTIVEQDAVFRRQVHDLHQLYSVQKTLMKGSSSNDFDGYNSWKYAAQSYPIPVVSSPSHQPLKQAARSKQPRIHEIAEGHRHLYHNLQNRSIDLQLPADQYISMVDEDPLDLKLSLSLGKRNKRKERTWFDRKYRTVPINVIDLDEPTPRISNRSEIVVIDLEESSEMSSIQDAKPGPSFGCAATMSNFGGKFERQVSVVSGPIISGSVKKDSSQEIVESSCLVNDSGDYRKQNSLNGGEYYADVECKNLSSKKQTIVSFEGELLDLNKSQPDDSSCYMTYHLPADDLKGKVGRIHEISPSTISRENLDSALNEISGVVDINVACTDSCSENHKTWFTSPKPDKVCASEVSLTVSELKSSSLDLCEGHGSTHGELKKEEDKSTSKLLDGSKSRSVSDGDSCSVKTMQSETDFGNLDSPASHKLSRTTSQAPESSEPKKQEESDQVDGLIQIAAESLLHISLSNADLAKARPNAMEIEKIDDKPQISVDSYELIAMNLTESNEDDYCTSSKPPLEVNEPENQDHGCKLRRGRRLKDFQKDILPGLACLSRHEICEDINILEGVLRSREYRKLRGIKAGDEGNWCSIARSRRSRRRKLL